MFKTSMKKESAAEKRIREDAERIKKQQEQDRYAAAMAQQGITPFSSNAQRRIADEMLRMRQASQPKLRQEEMTRAMKSAGQGTGFNSGKLYNFQSAAADARISNIGKKLENEQDIIKNQGRAADDPARIRAQEEYAKALEEMSAARKQKEGLMQPKQQLLPNDRISLDGKRTAYSAEEEAEIRKIQGRIEKGMSQFRTIPAMYKPKVKEDIHNLNMAAVKTDKDYAAWLNQGANAGLYNDEQTRQYRENYFFSNLPDSRNTREYSAYIQSGIEQGIFDNGDDLGMMSTRKLRTDIDELKKRKEQAAANSGNNEDINRELYDVMGQQGAYRNLEINGLFDPYTQKYHTTKPEDYDEWDVRDGSRENTELSTYYDSLLYDSIHGQGAYSNILNNGTEEEFNAADAEIQDLWQRMEDGTIGQLGDQYNNRIIDLQGTAYGGENNLDRQIAMREEELERRRQQGEYERSTEGAAYSVEEGRLGGDIEGAISQMRKTRTGDEFWEYADSPEATYVMVNEAALTAEDMPINGNVIDQGANLYKAEKEYRKYAHMTPKMVETFNGLYAQDKEKAMAYLKTLEPYLNSMQGDYVAGLREQAARGGLGALYGAETILTQPVAGIEGTVGTVLSLLGNKDAQNKYSGWYKNITRNQQVRGARAKSWGDFFADTFGEQYRGAGEWLNGVTYSIADNLMAMATAKAGGAVFGYDMASDAATRLVQVVMSGEATASAMAEALEKNMDPAEAAIRSIGNGLIEAATEKYSIEALLKPDVREMLGNWKQIGKFLLKNTVAEGAEEGASDILNTVWDEMLSSMNGHESELMAEYNQLIAGGMSEKEASRQVWKNWLEKTGSDMTAGALSGLLMSGGRVAMNTYNQIREGRTVRGANNTVGTKTGADQLIEAARGMNEGTVSRQMAEDMFEAAQKGKKASNRDVGRLAQNMAQESSEQVAQIAEGTVDRMVREELGNKGVTVEIVDKVAPIITQAAMTDSTASISKADRAALAQDRRVIETFKDFMSDSGRIATGMAVEEEAKQPLSVRETVGNLLKGDNVESTKGAVAREAAESAARAEENLATEEEIKDAKGRATNTGLDAVWNGNLVQVIGLKDGKYQLKTADGIATANITDVAAAGAKLGTVMDYIGRSGLIDDAAASAMITGIRANPKLSGGKYAAEAMNVYMAARTGGIYETAALDTETANAIRKAAEQQNTQEREDRLKKGEAQKKLAPGEGKTTYDGAEFGTDAWKEKLKGLNSVQRGQANVLAEMVRVSGNELELINDEENDGVFGWEEDTGKITINLAAKDSSGAALNRSLLTIAGHELTHWLEQNSREGYDQLRQYVFDRLRENGGDVASLVLNKIDRYRTIKGQENIGIEGAMAEIVADACDQVLLNRKTAEAMQQEYSGLAGKVRNFVKGFIQRWENAIKVQSSSSTSRILMNQGEEVMNQIAENWNIARREAAGQREGTGTAEGSRQMSAREIDDQYMDSVNNGDMETAQLMVDEAAKRAGYTLEAYHGTGEYFNVFDRGFEGIHLGNLEQASQIASARFEMRSKKTDYEWKNIRDSVKNMTEEQRESLVQQAYYLGDFIENPENIPPFEGDITDDNAVKSYVDNAVSVYEDGAWNKDTKLRIRTFDRKTGINVMRLYAKINNPFVINGDIHTWSPTNIADVIASRNGGDERYGKYGHDVDITGSDIKLTTKELHDIYSIVENKDEKDEQWDKLSEILKNHGYDGIKYKNEYEGDKNSYSYIALKQSDVKSADPVVYDDAGNVIPLSERFNTQNPDIRYSVQENGDIVDENGDPIAKVLEGGTVAQYSQRTWDEDDKDALIRTLVERGLKKKDVQGWINDVNGIAAKIAEDPQRLDYEATSYNRMLKNNQEYVKTLDTSTLCAKRLLYQGIYNEIQHMLPNTPLLPEDLINLLNLMKKKGQVTPCGICYVESRRKQLGKYASDWLKGYDGEYKPRMEDLTTTDGLEKLRKEHKQAYDDFIAAMKAKGSANPKVVQLRTEYRGDIREMTDSQIKKVKEIGGLRVQSFSDFETVHLIDMMQAVLDMAGKGLTSQAYTKVPAFAWVFGNTGMKINLSLIGKDGGVDANGNLLFDDEEGMPFKEAMALREAYSKNVGTILVGMNDAHIIAAMADDRIDFIIPFHKSGWSKKEMSQVIGMGAYKDYTRWQNEKKIAGKKANGKGYQTIPNKTSKIQNFGPVGPSGKWDGQSGYWDFSKTGTQNAERYLQLCAADKRMPKFANFLVDNGDGTFRLPTEAEAKNDKRAAAIRKGYWKMLIDFKMYDNEGNGSEQTAVTPDFNMEKAYQILKDYKGGANSLPTNHGIAKEFVEQYKKAHPRKNYSARETDAEYMDAVQRGDMKTAARLVEEAAKKAFPNSILIQDGKFRKMWHHTSKEFTEFLPGNNPMGRVKGIYFTPQEDSSMSLRGERHIQAYLNVENLKFLEAVKDDKPFVDELVKRQEGITDRNEIARINREFKEETGVDAFFDWRNGWYNIMTPEQIKLADPVTYDDAGNVIPLSERFNTENPDIRYSVREEDNRYMDAVEYGDMETAGQIIEDAARAAGYPERAYHGTTTFGFTEFNINEMQDTIFVAYDPSLSGTYARDGGNNVRRIYDKPADLLSMNEEEFVDYLNNMDEKMREEFILEGEPFVNAEVEDGEIKINFERGFMKDSAEELIPHILDMNPFAGMQSGVYELFTRPGKQLVVDANGDNWNNIHYIPEGMEVYFQDPVRRMMGWSTRELASYAMNNGYDSIRINNVRDFGGRSNGAAQGDIGIFFNTNDVKSADPVTYDDEGKVIPPSRRFSGENDDLRYSVRDEGDMDVQAWMLTLKPEDLRTEQERLMLKQYKGLRMRADLVRYDMSQLRTKIRAVERRMREKGTNVADREALRKLNNKYSEAVNKLHRTQDELARVTTQEGYAAMMYRESENMNRLVKGKTVKQVQQSVEALTAAAQRTQKRIEEREQKIREMANTEAVKQIQALLTGGHLDQMAAWLRKTYQSDMNKQQLMAEMSEIRLKMAAGEDVSADGEILAWKLLYGIHYTQDPVLAAMRGITLKLGPKQVKEIYGSDMTMKELRSRLAGTGIKVVQAEKSGLDADWAELTKMIPELNPEANELEQMQAVLNLVEQRREHAMMYGVNKYRDNIAEVTADVLAATAAVNMDKPKDPQAMAILKRMNRMIQNMAGTMTESTEVLAEARAQIGELVQHGQLASDMTRAMQKNVEDAIKYNNALVEQSEAVTWNGERLKLINQMKDKHTQEMLEQQEKWREKIAKDKAARDLQAENLQTRQKINRNIVRIRNLLMNETDIKNIPEHMKSLARATLAYIVNNDLAGRKISGISKEDLAETARLLTAWNMQDGKFDISDLQMIEDEEAQAMVADALADIEDGIAEYNGDTKGKDAIQNMTMFKNALEKILDGVATVKGVIDAERTIAFMDRKVAVTDAAMDIMNAFPAKGGKGELKGRGAKAMNAVIRSVGYGNETPVYFFKNLKNKGIDELWNGMQGAENRNGLLIQETQAWMDKLAEETHYASWDHDKKYTVKLNGAPVQMTIEQMMAVYATWQREQKFGPENSSHMEDGGIYLEDEDGGTEKLHREKKPQRARRVKQGDIEAIEKMFTEDQKKYIDAVVKYLSSNMSELGNEASMRMYGIRKYKEDYYFPMKIWNGVKSARSDKGISGTDDNRIAHQGWSKRRRNNAQNALVIGNFTDTAVKHMVEMINYATFAPEIENLNKVLNWQYIEEEMDEDENGRHVAENRRNIRVMFQENYGKEALHYLEEFMKDLQGGVVQDQRKTLRDKALTIFKKNAVAGSLSVAAQQPLSYIRAAMMINPKYLAEALLPANNKGSYTERMKYSGVSVIKEMGRFDMNFGQSARDFITPEVKKKGAKAVLDKAAEATTMLPEIMDRVTWNRMWTAVKLEQAAKNPDMEMDSEEFLKKAGERFNEVMRMTQVYDSTMVKSSNMRSQNLSMKILTSFMAEPTLSLNVLADAVRNVNGKGGKLYMARAGATFLLSAVMQAMVKGLIGTGRTPDEKKTWMENFLYKWQMNLQSEVNPFGLIPGYSDIIELLKNGELKDDAMGALGKIKSIITTAQNMFNPEKSKGIYRDIEDSAAQLAQLFTNVPAKNLMRDARAIYNWVSGSAYAGRPTSGAVVRQQALETAANADSLLGVLNQYLGESGYRTTSKGYYRRMADAMVSGNQEAADEIREYMSLGKGASEDSIKSGLKTAIKEKMEPAEATEFMLDNGLLDSSSTITTQYKDGTITAEEAKKLYRKADPKLTENDVWWKIDRIDYQKETGAETVSGNYYRLKDAVNANKAADIQKAVNDLLKHGIAKEKIKDKLSDWKSEYLKADNARKIKIRDAITKAYKAAGYTAAEADATIKRWAKETK